MRIATAAILNLALACSKGEPTGPQLRYVGIGMDQEKIPLVFALKLANDGDAPAVMDRMALKVDRVMPLYDDETAGDVPTAFDATYRCSSNRTGHIANRSRAKRSRSSPARLRTSRGPSRGPCRPPRGQCSRSYRGA